MIENICPFCKNYCKGYILCYKCLENLKAETEKEAIKEFAKQTNLPKDEQNQFYKKAVSDFEHNYIDDELNTLEIIEIIKSNFIPKYKNYLIRKKLDDIYKTYPDNYPVQKRKEQMNKEFNERLNKIIDTYLIRKINNAYKKK